jgi:tetratricopeptide (TPR) repeat protein/predicted aspartyl protease
VSAVRFRALGCIPLLLAASLSAAAAADRCRLLMTPPLPVRMEDLRPVISTRIDGVEARFIVDTGSFFDFISPAAAAQFQLPITYAPPFFYVNGIGGSFIPKLATAKTFTVAGITSHGAEFLVGDNDFGGGIAGVLGQNLFRIMDVDFDFADGVLRFAKPEHCGNEALAYWASAQPIGVVDLHWTSERQPHLLGRASVNGHKIEVLFDTGSSRTILSLRAAERAGITPESPGVVPAGMTTGLGRNMVRVWSAPVDKFEIGGETIEHTRVLIGDIGLPPELGADMLLGSDFFLAHHIYVAYSQNKLYFTYNGGPVFALNARQPAPPASAPPPGAAASTSAAPTVGSSAPAAPVSDLPTDAAGFMRRGMAEASRGELPQAIADLTHACDFAPTDAGCRYQRGLAYWHGAQPQAALADFNAAIQLEPSDFEALLARAQLELPRNPDAAESDLDAVDRLAPQPSDLRLMLAHLYDAAGEYAGAVHQYDLWVDYHARDVRLPYALAGRCGSEAAANVDVDRALEDCNTALHTMPNTAPAAATAVALADRGLVYLRQSKLRSALADFEGALQRQPKFPLARYGRGLVELRLGDEARGRDDLAAAGKLNGGIAGRLAKMGFAP